MKSHILPVLLVIWALMVSGCAKVATPTEPPALENTASLIIALEAAGATVETGEPVSQVFFRPEGSIIKVNGADVQVFEYESAEAMESEASQVAPDGGSIGTTMVTWVDTPHFYKASRILALYIGSDETVLGLLQQVMGTQFAGR